MSEWMPDVKTWMHLPLTERVYVLDWWLGVLIGLAGCWAAWQMCSLAYRLSRRSLKHKDTDVG